ncbi:Na/Pi symporter [Mesorhizobium sp. CAU 1741]|uniref:Na/Pi cotransporter family protein n=1 Tax=Mesorhizobium sp. CAU 1741 TaxID=3140366 RepID=UPI00325B718C
MDIFAAIFAGLGLFFVGVKLIGSNIKQLGGRRFRKVLARATANPFSAASLGMAAGALTQSTNAVTFISINAVAAGLVPLRRILPVIVWANVGTSLLVLLAALNIHLLVLMLLGFIGLLYYFEVDRSDRFRHVVAALLGVGLLFLGLDLIRTGAGSMREVEEIRAAIGYASGSFVLAFLAGLVVTLAAQSSATVTMVAVAMAEAGLFEFDMTMMIVYGAGVGSGLSVWLMAMNLAGASKQIAVLQTITKCTGALVLVPLFAVGQATDWPAIRMLLDMITPVAHEKIAWLYLIYQLVSALIMSLALGPVFRIVERLYPETLEESLAKPRFIHSGGEVEVETGLLLVEREQQRLAGYLCDAVDWLREDTAAQRAGMNPPRLLLQAVPAIGEEISRFLSDLIDTAPPREAMERLTAMRTGQDTLNEMAVEIAKLVDAFDGTASADALEPAYASMVESLHLVLMIMREELETRDAFQRESLLLMTADRSDMMDSMRRQLMRGDQSLSKGEQERLFAVTIAFEHSIWLIRRYVTLVGAG